MPTSWARAEKDEKDRTGIIGGSVVFSNEEIQSLNALEMSVYNYVAKNREKVVYMKIRELAAQAHVSTTTVLHMCKKFGCDGYTEFKLRLKQEMLRDKRDVADLDISALQDFLSRLSSPAIQTQIDGVVELLRGMGHVLFIGVGNSSILARYGARYLCNVGYFATAIDDPFTPISGVVNTQAKFDKVAVVALSVSGETEQIISMTQSLKERGCVIISITNSASCTLARLSDYNLIFPADLPGPGALPAGNDRPAAVPARPQRHLYRGAVRFLGSVKKVPSSRHVRMDGTHTGKFGAESVRGPLGRVRGSALNFV